MLFLQVFHFFFFHQHSTEACFDPLGHQACYGGNKVPSWPIFWAAFQATSLWHSAPAPFWTSASKELCELDWHPHGLIDCRTLFVNVIPDVLDVSISDKPRNKWRECAWDFHCLLPFWLQSLPSLKTWYFFFLFCSFCWQVRKWAQENCQLLRLPGILPTAFQRYSSYPYPHVWWPVIALLQSESPLHRKGLILTDLSLQTRYFHELTAEFCCCVLPYIQLSSPLCNSRTVSL